MNRLITRYVYDPNLMLRALRFDRMMYGGLEVGSVIDQRSLDRYDATLRAILFWTSRLSCIMIRAGDRRVLCLVTRIRDGNKRLSIEHWVHSTVRSVRYRESESVL